MFLGARELVVDLDVLGDDALAWAALEDEDGGRVLVEARGTGLGIAPTYVVAVSMLQGRPCES